jgi:hypothetical protein
MAVILEIRCCNILVNVVLHLIASILNRGNRSTEPGHRQQYFIDEKCCGRSAIGCVCAMGFLSRSLASSRGLIYPAPGSLQGAKLRRNTVVDMD